MNEPQVVTEPLTEQTGTLTLFIQGIQWESANVTRTAPFIVRWTT